MKWILVLSLFFVLSTQTVPAVATTVAFNTPPSNAIKSCTDLKAALTAKGIALQSLQVPADYSSGFSTLMNVAYWVRAAKTSVTDYPPLLLVHGGPAGFSNRFLTWTKVINDYPGDVIALDVRGDGCSSELSSGLPIDHYNHLRARNIVRDLEELRTKLYGKNTKWRVFGQSRGSVVGHYYLDMFPDSIESLHLHGYSMGTPQSMAEYSRIRSFFSARASWAFAIKYPQAGTALKKLRKWLDAKSICFDVIMHEDVNSPHKVCGGVAVDGLSFELTNQANWSPFAAKLEGLIDSNGNVDETAARQYLQSKLENHIYVDHMNYVMGTNGQDMGQPNPAILENIDQDFYIKNYLI